MQHDKKSAGGRIATDSAMQTGVEIGTQPLRRRTSDAQRLSFVTDWETHRGRLVRTDYFDPVLDDKKCPYAQGLECARELLGFVKLQHDKAGCDEHYLIVSVWRRVLEISFDRSGRERRQLVEAAWAVRTMLATMVSFGAVNASFEHYIERLATQSRADYETAAAEKEQQAVEWAARMKAAKGAKVANAQATDREVSHG